MSAEEMLEVLEATLKTRRPPLPLDTDKASRALLGLLDPDEHMEAYESAASTNEGAEVFSEAADHLASLDTLSDADVQVAALEGGARGIVAQALSEVRAAYVAVSPRPSLTGLREAVQRSLISLQQARAVLSLRMPSAPAASRSGSETVRGLVREGRLVLEHEVRGPALLVFQSSGVALCDLDGDRGHTEIALDELQLLEEGQEVNLTVLHNP
jgi:hypothetical protein